MDGHRGHLMQVNFAHRIEGRGASKDNAATQIQILAPLDTSDR
jgi:hypothetical protein